MATTFCTPLDNAATTLASGRAAGATTAAVKAGDGPLFGSPSASAPVRVTLVAASAVDAVGFLADRSKVVTYLCTGRSGDTLSGLTAESGTDAGNAAGDYAAVLIDAASLAAVHAAVNALEAGGAGGSTYTFTQASPSAVWTIAHNLNRHPSVTVVDSAGGVVYGDVAYDSPNQVTISFGVGGFSGQAYLN